MKFSIKMERGGGGGFGKKDRIPNFFTVLNILNWRPFILIKFWI